MVAVLIYRGNRISEGAKALKEALLTQDVKARLNKRDSIPNIRSSVKVINWGVSSSSWVPDRMLNKPDAVDLAVDKLQAFDKLSEAEVSIPEYDYELGTQRQGKWLARTELRGSGGEGIVVIREGDPVPSADLYVRYVPKRREYRVHVFNGKAIAVQQKRKRNGVEQDDDQALIRNAANGWVFCVDNVEYVNEENEQAVKAESVKAVKALGLDFAAVDIIVGRDDNKPYVLELNTAPGLESPTVIAAYVAAIKEWANER